MVYIIRPDEKSGEGDIFPTTAIADGVEKNMETERNLAYILLKISMKNRILKPPKRSQHVY